MNWRFKAAVQNAVALLPSGLSYSSYYWLQRRVGRLRRINPVSKLRAGIETWEKIRNSGGQPGNKIFFEIGTGRVPLVPLSYWLMGGGGTVTVDANPYLRAELIRESLRYLADHRDEVQRLFGSSLNESRFEDLLSLASDKSFTPAAFFRLCGIDYRAPCDAADTGLPAQSVDFHTSQAVLEHIPPEPLKGILEEGNRIIRDGGLFVHRIDYSDHFSHTDRSISAINFLQYSDEEWARLAGNRYMYMNRWRHDDFLSLFEEVGHDVLDAQVSVDEPSRRLLVSGALKVDRRFEAKPIDVLAIRGAWVVSKAGNR